MLPLLAKLPDLWGKNQISRANRGEVDGTQRSDQLKFRLRYVLFTSNEWNLCAPRCGGKLWTEASGCIVTKRKPQAGCRLGLLSCRLNLGYWAGRQGVGGMGGRSAKPSTIV